MAAEYYETFYYNKIFYKRNNTFIQKGCIQLFKSDSKDNYDVTKDFCSNKCCSFELFCATGVKGILQRLERWPNRLAQLCRTCRQRPNRAVATWDLPRPLVTLEGKNGAGLALDQQPWSGRSWSRWVVDEVKHYSLNETKKQLGNPFTFRIESITVIISVSVISVVKSSSGHLRPLVYCSPRG